MQVEPFVAKKGGVSLSFPLFFVEKRRITGREAGAEGKTQVERMVYVCY